MLAARLMQQLGVSIIPLYCSIPFRHRLKNHSAGLDKLGSVVQRYLGQPLRRLEIDDDFLELIRLPCHGFGSNMNPCVDCKILMFQKAKSFMQQHDAAFMVTGEVVGQRPMSQRRHTLRLIEDKAEVGGLVVRPLSAKILPETIPEQRGWIDRTQLFDFNGRSRKPQFALAQSLGITDYAQPAGGCLLTDPLFSNRLKELMAHQELTLANVALLRVGRHFRLSPTTKLIVGRDKEENSELEHLAQDDDLLFFPHETVAGPTALGRGLFDLAMVKLAGEIVCRYCDRNGTQEAVIQYRKAKDNECKCLKVAALNEAPLAALRL